MVTCHIAAIAILVTQLLFLRAPFASNILVGGTIPMLANAIKLVLVTTTFASLTINASAAKNVHPNCVKSKDKVKCTCFFTNGATIDNFNGRLGAYIWTIGQMDAYIACMKRHGRA
jgi:hypothetical protein